MGQKRNYANQKRQTLEIPLYQKKTKKIKDRIITNISTLFWKRRRKRRKKEIREKKHNERLIKDRLIRGIRTLFKQEEDYYKPGRVNNSWNNNCIEYGSNGNKNGDLPLDEYLNKNKPYLRNIVIHPPNSDTKKIHLTIKINLISSKDAEEEHVMHPSSDNIKYTSYSDYKKVIDELFESLCSRYQVNLETSMRGSNFTFDSVQMLYYKCHQVNAKRGGFKF